MAAEEIAEAPVWVKQWSLNRTLAASSPDANAQASSNGVGDKLNRLSAELRSRITADVAVGSRSEVSISVMEALIAEGFTKEEILDVFLLHPIGAKFREKGMPWFTSEFEKASVCSLSSQIPKTSLWTCRLNFTQPCKNSSIIPMKENIIESVRWARELFSSTSNRKNVLG